MKQKTFFFLSIVFIIFSRVSFSQSINIDVVKKIAENQLLLIEKGNLKSANTKKSKARLTTVSIEVNDNDTLYYILNDTVNKSFVIVSADKSAWPVLGYSTEGIFQIDNIPPNFAAWMNDRKNEIIKIKDEKLKPDKKISQQWENLTTLNAFSTEETSTVVPLIKTQWNQGCYYNTLCPADAAGPCGHVWAGCVATAMAQIMKYWSFPTKGTGSHYYTHSSYGNLEADFGSTTYQWSQMPDNVTTQNDAIATLMFHCGVSVDMNYGPDNSGAGEPVYAFVNYFKYSTDAMFVNKSNYSETDWVDLLKSELDLKRPIYYSGNSTDTGHAWICDGYENSDYFHFNWGWGGYQDGYFYLGSVNYNSNQGAVINLSPTSLPDNYQGFFLSANRLTIGGNGGAAKINISSSANWTATSNNTWLTLSTNTGTQGTSEITLTADVNSTTSTRSATVTISVAGFDDQIIYVNQGIDFFISSSLYFPGTLHDELGNKLASITRLKLSGNIDARDFKTIRDEMPLLAELDLHNAEIVEYTGTNGTFGFGSNLRTYEANTIPDDAFFNNNTYLGKTSLTKIILPYSIKAIGSRAFQLCEGLTTVSIPDSVYTIEWGAFFDCKGMTSLYIPSLVSFIGNGAFSANSGVITVAFDNPYYSSSEGVLFDKNQNKLIHCPTSKSGNYIIPSSVASIENGAFQACNKLTSIYIPSSVISIGEGAFFYCHGLSSITIPPSVTTIGERAFWYNSALINVDDANLFFSSYDGALFNKDKTKLIQCSWAKSSFIIPSTVIEIGAHSFENCTKLISVTIPSSVQTIGNYAFWSTCNLSNIYIPYSVTSIGEFAFHAFGTFSGGILNVSSDNPNYKSVDGILFDKFQTKLIMCPDFIKGTYKVPSTVEIIVDRAFMSCYALTSITIPSSVKVIGYESFSGCTALTSINVFSTIPIELSSNWYSGSYNVFNKVDKSTCKLNVPFFSLSLYANAPQWKDFFNIKERAGFYPLKTSAILSSSAGSNTEIDLKANVKWTANSNQSWLTVFPTSGSGDAILKFTATSNTSTAIRVAKVIISADSLESQEIIITQTIKISVTAGGLYDAIAATIDSITCIEISGTIDARDFRTMRDLMPKLNVIDLSQATIIPYSGTEGTNRAEWGSCEYPANEIPDYSFFNPTTGVNKAGLLSIILPNSLVSIGDNAFYYCSGLMSINIPSEVTLIGNYAFYNCVGLNSVIIPSSVKTIGNYTFGYCKALTSFSLPSSVSSIGYYAFYYCSGLSSLYSYSIVPVNLDLSPNVFYNINKTSCILYVPYGTKPNYQASSQWKDFLNIVEMSGLFLSANTLDMGANSGTTCVEIASSGSWTAVSDQTWLTIGPPSGALGIGKITLSATTNLTTSARTATVTVSASGLNSKTILVTQYSKVEVTPGILKQILAGQLATITNLTLTGTIDARDFKTMRDEMPLLSSLDLSGVSIVAYSGEDGTSPYNTDYPADAIPEQAFFNSNTYKGKPLKNIIFPLSLTSIENSAFAYCSHLTTVIIPEGVISIGSSAFSTCQKLVSVIIPSSVNYIGSGTFNACTKLISIDIPSSLSTIEYGVFRGCSSLTSITIPSSVTSIGSSAFEGCIALTNVYIPSSVVSIENRAFIDCSGLFTVDFDNPNFSGNEGVLYNKAQTILIQCPVSKTGDFPIPSYIKTIGANAFNNCKGLTSINIPSGISSIEMGAFYNCTGLTTINIPVSVSTIENYAFQYCNNVASVYAYSVIPVDLGSSYGVFYGINKTTATLYVPFGTKVLYAASGQWQDFCNINEMPGIFLSDNTLGMGANSGTKDVSIASSASWTAVSEQVWLTINPTSGAAGANSITLSAAANLTTSARIATVTISASGLDPKTILVTQYGITEVTAGNLKTKLSGQLETITNLTLIGTIDARDFRTMRDEMPQLASIDLSKATIVGYTGTEGTYPTDWGSYEYPANEIPVNAFFNSLTYQGKTSLESIVLSELTTAIGNQAFYNCTQLSSIDLNSNLISIGSSAFNYCTGLTSLNIPASVNSIGDYAFYYSENISSITVFGITPIDLNNNNDVFYGIDKTNCILYVPFGTKPDYKVATQWKDFLNIVEMQGLFLSASSLSMGANPESTDVKLASSAEWTASSDQGWLTVNPSTGLSGSKTLHISVTGNLLENSREAKITISATGLESKTITVTQYGRIEVTAGNLRTLLTGQLETVTNLTLSGTIDARDFRTMRDEMPQLASIDLSQATIVGYSGTEGTYPAEWGSYDFPANEIPDYAFLNLLTYQGKTSLESIVIPESTTTVGDQAFNSCTNLYSVHLNSNLTSIGNEAFYNCPELTSIELTSNLTSIGSWAFYYCTSLTSLSIPESVNAIGDGAFYESGNINSIYVFDFIPIDLSNNYAVFTGIDIIKCVLYVPAGTISLYQAASQWQDFLNIVEMPNESTVCQTLNFNSGWNIISIPLTPESEDLVAVFQPLISNSFLVKIMNEDGYSLEDWGIYGGWKNNIGNVSPTEGYKVKVGKDDNFEICGAPVQYPFAIPLKSGWNIMGYPQTEAFNALEVLKQLINEGKLVKVQDEGGFSIEDWGIYGGWKNNIGDFVQGKGYNIKLNADATLWINETYPKSSSIQPEFVATSHFKPVFTGNGIDHMNINLVGLPANILQAGDELAVFDGATCVGAVTLTSRNINNQSVAIAASASDKQGMPGFTEGNTVLLKLWNSKQNIEYTLEPDVVKGSSLFTKYETTFASLEKYATTGLEGIARNGLTKINCYPNPFSDEVTVEIKLVKDSEVQVEVLNQLGQRVRFLQSLKMLNSGVHRLTWDGKGIDNRQVSTGIYHLRIKINDDYIYKKIVYSH